MVPLKLTHVLQALDSPSGLLWILMGISPEPLKSTMGMYLVLRFLELPRNKSEKTKQNVSPEINPSPLKIVLASCLTMLSRHLRDLWSCILNSLSLLLYLNLCLPLLALFFFFSKSCAESSALQKTVLVLGWIVLQFLSSYFIMVHAMYSIETIFWILIWLCARNMRSQYSALMLSRVRELQSYVYDLIKRTTDPLEWMMSLWRWGYTLF